MKSLQSKQMLVWVLLLVTSITTAQSPVTLSQVTVAGNKFMVGGKAFVFRGLDASDPDKLAKEGHWNREYFEAIKSWGANIVRFPVHPAAWRNRARTIILNC